MTHSPQYAILVFALGLSLVLGQILCNCANHAAASDYMAAVVANAETNGPHDDQTHQHSAIRIISPLKKAQANHATAPASIVTLKRFNKMTIS